MRELSWHIPKDILQAKIPKKEPRLRELFATSGKTTTKKSVSISLPLGYIDVDVDDRGT